MKRGFDFLVAAIGLIVAGPLLLGIAAAIKLDSPGPVFYRGRRVGRFGRPFRIFKFRSMVVNAEAIGGSSTGDDDPRITRVGKLMRKAKLDELPQLINVLLGDMSFVGPRPEVQQYVDMYTDEERRLLELRPGITDWASIWNSDEGAILAGAEDPDRAYEELIRPTKLKLQLAYADHHSLWVDLKILCYTAYAVSNRDFVPDEVLAVLAEHADAEGETIEGPARLAAGLARRVPQAASDGFGDVSELPGMGATREQLSMVHTRYRLALELCEGKDVLELACGPGFGLGCLSGRARRVVAGDYDRAFVDAAAAHYGSRVDVQRLDAQQLPFSDESFDVILLLEAIYFLREPERFAAEARRVLRPGGSVLVVSANRERADFNASPKSHRYLSAHELQQLLAAEGFETELYAAYHVAERSALSRLLGLLRRTAVRFRLIPGSMQWKTRIKRLLFGRLEPLPQELELDETQCADVVPIDAARPVPHYKVLYAIGRRAA